MKPQCIQAVNDSIGRKITTQEAKDIELSIRDSMRQLAQKDANWKNLSDSERLTQAAAKVGGMLQAEAIRKAKIAADDILKQSRNMSMLTDPRFGSLPAIERIDRTVAFFSDQSGIQSINSQANVLANTYIGRLTDVFAQTKGGIAAWIDPNLVKGMVRELFGENSGDPLAKTLGKQIADVMEDLRLHFNRVGGDIGKLLDWGLPQGHSAYKLLEYGKDKWVDYVLPLLNRNKYINEHGHPMDDATLKDFLRNAYQTITTDGANNIPGAGQPKAGGGNSRLTSRHAESRQIHFKNADAWMEYQADFGSRPFIDLINGHVRSVARDIVLIDRLGSSPEGAMKILLKEAKRIDVGNNGMRGYKFNYKQWRVNSMFNELTGKIEIGNEKIANLGRAYRSINVSSMLGGTTISSIPDQAMTAKTAAVHGIAYNKVFGELVHNLNPASKEDRKLAYSMGIATEDLVGSLSRYLDQGLANNHGDFAKLANVADLAAGSVMRLSLLNHLTQSNKMAIEKMMLNNFWEKTREWDWQTMDAGDKKIFEGGGITQREWDIFKLADQAIEDSRGTKMLNAQAIYNIPDDKILAAMDGDVKTLVDNIDAQIKELDSRNAFDDQRMANRGQKVDDIKRQLSQRLLDYANRKDTKSQAEKQALQDRIDLIDAQKEATAAQADMNAYLRNVENSENLKGFMDGITQGKTIDNLTDKAKKLGRTLESLDNKVVLKTTKLNDKIKTFEKEIQGKFTDFKDLLGGKSKLSKEKLAEYEDRLSERLNSYASRRDVNTQKELDALSELKELVALKQEHLDTNFEITKAKEQTRIKGKTDSKIDSSVSQNARRNYKSGEGLGYRLGNSERRIIELRGKMRSADSAANKAITQKFKDLDKRVNELDAEFIDYQAKVAERQSRRDHVSKRLFNSITDEKKALAQKIRDDAALKLMTYVYDERGMAVVEGGLRERSLMNLGIPEGSWQGFILRGVMQFKTYAASMLMRHGSRFLAQKGFKGKAAYGLPLIAMTTLLGGLVIQLREIKNGNDPAEMWDGEKWYTAGFDTDFLKRSFVAGGGLPALGDIITAGADTTGRDINSFLTGPLGSDFKTALNLTVGNATQLANGVETNAANEAFKAVKSKTPAQNLWYTQAAANRLIFDEFQDMIAPGYREKLLRKAERQHDRTRFWGDDIDDIRAPDFDKVVQ